MKSIKMLDKLGWKLEKLDFEDYEIELKYVKSRNEYPNDMWIIFGKDKTWCYGSGIDYIEEVSVELHQAITKQMIELGWLNE